VSGIHINRGTNRTYIAQSRPYGFRKWRTLKESKSSRVAARTAALAVNAGAKRGRVLFCSDYYDPVVLIEMVRP
jgi:hypothetical protein